MLKTIAYAFATSVIADKLNAPNGCFYVATKPNEETPEGRIVGGPFRTIGEAEDCAATLDLGFSRFTKRRFFQCEKDRAPIGPRFTSRELARDWLYSDAADEHFSDKPVSGPHEQATYFVREIAA